MQDLIFIVLAAAFFAGTAALVVALARPGS